MPMKEYKFYIDATDSNPLPGNGDFIIEMSARHWFPTRAAAQAWLDIIPPGAGTGVRFSPIQSATNPPQFDHADLVVQAAMEELQQTGMTAISMTTDVEAVHSILSRVFGEDGATH